MGKRKLAALEKIDADFASLQAKCRRDPRSYQDEFERQYESYCSQREIFVAAPASASPDQSDAFSVLIDFLSHVADCYPDALRTFPEDLKTILTQHHIILSADLRERIVGSLVLLRRKDVIDSTDLCQTFFPILVSTPSKTLRTLLFQKILSDLRNSNSRTKNHRLNRTIQTVLYNLVTSDRTSPRALWAVKLTRELWARRVWDDERPVDVMREACLADNEKVAVAASRFFLSADKDREEVEDDSSEEEAGGGGAGGVDLGQVRRQQANNKKTKKRAKMYEKALEKVKKAERRKSQAQFLNFSALHLLHGPQEFCEKLFAKHLQNSKSKMALESRLLILQLCTRLVGMNKLVILPLFSYFLKFVKPSQESVTSFLASLAQAVHDQVPPDAIEPLLMKLANEFVSEGSAAEVATAGLNAIREICVRQPLAMNETLLQDLVTYRKSKDKGVMMAARSLLSLYRSVYPELLMKKDRGKDATIGLKSGSLHQRRFGEEEIGGIEGIELLEKWKEEEKKRKRAEREGGEGGDGSDDDDASFNSSDWDVDSDDSNDSGGWIDVSHSDDEEPAPKRLKKKKAGSSAEPDEEEDDDDDEDEDEEADKEDAEAEEGQKISKLATTSILTPADLAKLRELRMEASVDKAMGSSASAARRQKELEARHAEEGLTAEQIELSARLRKMTREERVAHAREGKPDREEHKSTQAIRKSKKQAEGKSTTNEEKAKKKNIFMTMGKARAKNKRSLVETRKALRAHVARSKRGGRRGNNG